MRQRACCDTARSRDSATSRHRRALVAALRGAYRDLMRKIRGWLAALVLVGSLAGCHHRGSHISGGVLGRVVIYRNGVAFYERNATVVDGMVTVRVPRERVDDFLKSLTIVDRATRKPLGITIPRQQSDDGNYLTMTLETPGTSRAEVLMTYVTEAPAWKPSYRVVVGKDGKVMLESWAVVDNTSSEDWRGVLVGVGASSALAFRYDLWSVRSIDRDLLQGEEKFAIAPPTGVSPYSDNNQAEELIAYGGGEVKGTPGGASAKQDDGVGVSFSGSSKLEDQYYVDGINTTGVDATATTGVMQGKITDSKTGEPLPGVTVVATSPALAGSGSAITDEHGAYKITGLPAGEYLTTFYYADLTVERRGITIARNKMTPVHQKLDMSRAKGEVIRIVDRAPPIDPTSTVQGVRIDRDYTKNIPLTGRTYESAVGTAKGSTRTTRRPNGEFFGGFNHPNQVPTTGSQESSPSKPPPPVKDERLKPVVARVLKDKRDVVIEVHGAPGTEQAAIARGQTIKNRLVDDGVPATKIHIVPKLEAGEPETVRVLAVAPKGGGADHKTVANPAVSRIPPGDAPVGESHFLAERPMTIRAGSSAMVAMVHRETTGGVVYLYDPVSERGDKRFAFKAVRLDNPTGDTLEPGPVTVYGDGRFIGEGITEPVPPRAAVVVPFALDKQIVVERTGAETDQIAKLVTVQRGILTAQVQHRRDTTFKVTSRLPAPTTVYLRHRLESGWSLVDHPQRYTKVGDSHLFEVVLSPGETRTIVVSEATPVERTFDLSTESALGMMKVFVNEPKASAVLKRQIDALLATHQHGMDLVGKIETLRDQLVEYRSRSGELHAQLVTLKAVKTSGDLIATLKARLAEMSDRTQKATIAIVDAQEKLMLAKIKFQNQLADLELTDATVSKR
jgi:hypothetical protein